MMYGWDVWGWGDGILMTLGVAAFWVWVITAIVLGMRFAAGGASQHNRLTSETNRPDGILAEP